MSARYWASTITLVFISLFAVLAATAILKYLYERCVYGASGLELCSAQTSFANEYTCFKMAKSLRSKRKRKLRAVKREKLKVKEKERLEMILGVSVKDTEMKNAEKAGTDGSESTEKMEQEHHDQAQEQGQKDFCKIQPFNMIRTVTPMCLLYII